MNRYLTSLIIVCVLLFSCKKEHPETNTQNTNSASKPFTTDYYGLSIGSYWVYNIYIVDTLNNSTFQNADSVWIKSDTVIRGNTYYAITGESPLFFQSNALMRDSSGWLVTNTGRIMCNNTGDTSIFSTTIDTGMDTIYDAMQSQNYSKTVPAGTFTCIDARGTCKFYKGYLWGNPRYLYNFYSSGVGLVFETNFYTSNPNHLEMRLVRYHIN